MRKILLATTALIGFAGIAQAAPLTVTVGGSVDFLAGAFHESKVMTTATSGGLRKANGDFETLYSLDFGIAGKAANGMDFGGRLALDNYPGYRDTPSSYSGIADNVRVTTADIFMSGSFGKVQVGDSRGATEMILLAPTVGAGQVYGRFIDFLGTDSFAKAFVVGLDGTDHSTNITYFTPKAGDEANKVQLAVSYVPNFYDEGSHTVLKSGDRSAERPYRNMYKGLAAYSGNFSPVKVDATAHVITATADYGTGANKYRDFISWGVGVQAAYQGFTLGGNYVDLGHSGTKQNQQKEQHQYGVGLTYDFCCKLAVGVSYLGGVGYDRLFDDDEAYVKSFNTYGVGAVYTWAPGLTTSVDGILFDQKVLGFANDGYVLLLSQKLAF